jgi:hypothetical protein
LENRENKPLIFNTLAAIIEDFFDKFPDVWIQAKGNTEARTRLYSITLSQNLHIIEPKYRLLGMYKGVWKPYQPNQPYKEFLIKRK